MRFLFRTKSLDCSIQDSERDELRLRRSLGPVQLTFLGIGAIVGAGIFSSVGTAAAGGAHHLGAGPALVLSLVLVGIACGFAGLCYAEFASMVPISGSAYTYAYATLGEFIAWIIGWDLILEYAIGNVAVAISWSGYFQELMRGIGVAFPAWLGTDYRSALQAAAKLAEATSQNLDLTTLGAELLRNAQALRDAPRLLGVPLIFNLPAFAIVFFAYIGFDAVSTAAEEARHPQRDMPIGILASLVICTVLYIAVALVLTGLAPWTTLGTAEPLASVFSGLNMPWTAGIISVGALIATTSVLVPFQLGQPRIFFSMARDGLLPPWAAKVHPRYRTPHVTTILTGVFVACCAACTNINEMVELTNIGTLFAFILVAVGILVLRRAQPDRPRPFRVPLLPWVPIGAILTCAYLMLELPWVTWRRFLLWLAGGLVIYFLYGIRRSRLAHPPSVAPPPSPTP